MTNPTYVLAGTNLFGIGKSDTFASPILVDIDGDGDLDALIGGDAGNTAVYRNAGSTTWPSFTMMSTNAFVIGDVGFNAVPAAGDIDGDGDLDLIIGNSHGSPRFYRNVGTTAAPNFSLVSSYPFGFTNAGTYVAPTLVDIDGDRDLDIVSGSVDGDIRVYRNVGTTAVPSFTVIGTNPFGLGNVGGRSNPTLVDIDGDGKRDALIGNANGDTLYYRNVGTTAAPSFTLAGTNPFGLGNVGTMAAPRFADIDGDGDLDVLIGNGNGDTVFFRNGTASAPRGLAQTNAATPTITGSADPSTTVVLYEGTTAVGTATAGNWGLWTATLASLAEGAHSLTAKASDANGTSSASTVLTVTIDQTAPSLVSAVLNGTLLTLTYSEALNGSSAAASAFAVSVGGTARTVGSVTTSGKTVTLALDAGATTYQTVTVGYTPPGSGAVTADAAGNAADALNGRTVKVVGDPNFTVVGNSPFGLGTGGAASVADIDGDGDLDVLIGNNAGNLILYRNVGTAAAPSFTLAGTNLYGLSSVTNYSKPTFGDFDGDGDLDLLVGNSAGSRFFFRNVGTAAAPSFTLAGTNLYGLSYSGNFTAPSFGDIDGDGDLDIVSGSSLGTLVVHRNVGTATAPSFTLVGTNPFGLTGVGTYAAPTLVDLDGDGDLDIVAGSNSGSYFVFRNVGTATAPSFTLLGTNPFGFVQAGASQSPVFADIDGDGDLDMLVGHATGTLTLYRNSPPPPAAPTGLALTAGTNSGSTADTVTNVAAPAITGTAAANATVVLYDGATALGTATADGAGAWTVASASLNDGAHSLTAKASDANGTSSASTALTVTIDRAAPSLVSAVVDGTILTLTYSETLDGSAPAASAYTVMVDGVARAVNAVNASGPTTTLTLASAVSGTQAVTVGYTPPGSGARTGDAAGNAAAALTAQPVVNTPSTPPTLTLTAKNASFMAGGGMTGTDLFDTVTASTADTGQTFTGMVLKVYNVGGNGLSEFLTIGGMDIALGTGSGAFNGVAHAVTLVNGVATVTLSGMALSNAAMGTLIDGIAYKNTGAPSPALQAYSETRPIVLHSITDSGASSSTTQVDRVATINIANTMINQPNIKVTPTSPTATFTPGTTTRVTFTVEVTAAMSLVGSIINFNVGAPTGWTVDNLTLDGLAPTLTGVIPLGTHTLTFDVTASGTNTSGAFPLSVYTTSVGAMTGYTGVSGSVMMTVVSGPILQSATVNGTTMVLTYDSALDAANPPGAGSFAVKIGGTTVAVTNVAVDGANKTVTLTLATAAANGDTVTVAYADPTTGNDTNAVQNAGGIDSAGFTAHTVTNTTPDTTPPSLVSALLNGTVLTLTYSEALNGSAPAASAFAVSVGGTARTVGSVTTSGKTVTLALDAGAAPYQTVTVSYTPPGSGAVTADAAGNAAGALSGQTVKQPTDPKFISLGAHVFGFVSTGLTYGSLGLGDLDGDGDLDLMIGHSGNTTVFYRNVGTTAAPSFTLVGTSPFGLTTTGAYTAPRLVDFDGDGDLDLLYGNSNNGMTAYRNVGTTAEPSFTLVGVNAFGFANSGAYSASSFADLDGDGDLDALIGNQAGDLLVYRNVGTTAAPSFTLIGTNAFGLANSGAMNEPRLVDIDGDGDFDVVISNNDGNTLFYRNVGTAAAPSFALVGTNPFGLPNVGAGTALSFADIDGDGDLDVLGGFSNGILAYRNVPAAPAAPGGLALTDGSNSGSTADSLTNVSAPAITGMTAAGATVVLYDGATALGTATADANGLWTVTPASLSDGAHSLTAKASDANGTSSASTTLTVTIDKTAPSLVSAVLNGTLLTLTYSEALDGSAAAASAFAVSVGGAARTVGSVVTSGTTVTLALDAGATAGQSVTVGYTPPGSGAVTADAAGNAAGALNGRTVKVVGDPNFTPISTSPFGLGNAIALTVGDLDGDGDLDALLASSDGNMAYYRNIGTTAEPSFTLVGTNPFGLGSAGSISNPTLVDIDGDGDSDLMIGQSNRVIFYRNVGTTAAPSFTLAGTNPFGLGSASGAAAPAFADLDGDGDLDVLIGNSIGNLYFYRNVGTTAAPSFTLGGTNPFGLSNVFSYGSPAFADLDGDGDLDLVVGSEYNSFIVFRNVGTTATPSFTLAGTNPFGFTNPGSRGDATIADIDGDGDLDVLASNFNGTVTLYRNGPPPPAAPTGLALAAGSNSGSKTDALTNVAAPAVTGTAGASATVVLYDGATAIGTATADGSGLWTVTPASLADGAHSLTAKATDANGTSAASTMLTVTIDKTAPSLVSAVLNGTLLTLTYSEALDGSAAAASAFAVSVGGAARTVGSVVTSGKTVTLALDAGASSTYQPVTVGYTPPGSGAVTADAAGNAADAINGRTVKVVGDPNFRLEATNPFGLGSAGYFPKPGFADIDGDGDFDVLITNVDGNTLFYRNVGTTASPSFTLVGTNPFGLGNISSSLALAVADIDGDGKLDLMFGDYNGNTVVYRNVGTAASPSFTLAGTNPFGLSKVGNYATPTLVDLDGDGDLDVLIGNSAGNTVAYRNVGTTALPSFTLAGTNAFGLSDIGDFARPVLVDLDGDGDLDVLIGNSTGGTVVYRNVGTTASPSFTLVGTNPFGLTKIGNYAAPTIVDIDGDGDLDLLAGDSSGNLILFRNAPPPPPAPTGLALTAGSNSGSKTDTLTNVSAPAITGTAAANATVVLYKGATALGTATADANGLWTVTSAPLNDGAHSLTAKASDVNGTSSASTTLTVTIDRREPSLVSAVLNGTLLTLTYSEALDGSAAAASAFAVSVGGAARTVGSVVTSGTTVTLALDAGATTYQTVTVGYTPPGSGAVTADAAGNAAGALNGRAVKVVGDPNFNREATNPFGLGKVGTYSAPSFADLDGDGDLDLLIGAYNGNMVAYRNVGTAAAPSFTLIGTNPFGLADIGSYSKPTLGDLDGDGDLDLLIGDSLGRQLYFRNVGTTASPSFTLAGTNPFGLSSVGSYSSPTFVDLDGDGDLDLVAGGMASSVVFRNVGTATAPSFTMVGTNPFGIANSGERMSPTFVDIDGDGDLDVLIGNGDGNLTLYRNAPPPPAAPTGLALTAASNSGSTADSLTNVAAPTITGSAVAGATVVLYDGATAIGTVTADGAGLWTITSASLNDGAHSLTAKASNVNGTSTASTTLTVTIDKAAPSLVSAVLNGTLLTLTYSEALDGSAAAASAFAVSVGGTARTVGSVVTSGKTVTLALDAGATAAQSVTVGYTPPGSGAVTADAAGNAAGALNGRTVKVVSDPNFTWEVANPFGLARETSAVAPAFVDIDGDGDVDAFLGTANGNTLFYRNVGTTASPSFTLVGTNPFGLKATGTPGTNTVNMFADIDGDGDLDLLMGNGTAIIAYRNVGTTAAPSFTLIGTNPFGLGTPENYAAPALADIDGDGDLDLLIGGISGNMVFYRNVGTTASPSFTLAGTNPFGLVKSGMNALPVFADIDGDGDLDLFAGSAEGNTYFYRNVGTATAPSFTLAGTNPFNLQTSVILSAPAAVDIDGDGDLDMLIGGGAGSTVLYRNTPPNTAPVLDASKSPVLAAVPVTSTLQPIGTVGSLVSDLVGLGSGIANVTDPDGGAATGIAITATDGSRGILWYSTDGGTTWGTVKGNDGVSDTKALLLKADANTRLYFQVTDTTYAGTVTSAFTFRAWDQTSGTAGTKVDTTTNGGTTPFSTNTDTVSVTITPVGPKVTDPNIAISGGTGTGGAYRIGDTVTVTWNNSVDGDNNTDSVSGVTVDFSQFGGAAAVAASSDANGVWTAKYVVTSGSIDATNRNVSVSATNSSGTATAADTTNATVDNVAPVLTPGNMAGQATPSGLNSTLRIGDTVTAIWDNSASGNGNDNADAIASVMADFSQFGGGTAVAMTNSGGVWTATYVIAPGSLDATNRNVSITVTDNAGNSKTVTDTANRKVDNIAPTVTDGNIAISGATGTGGAYRIGDTVTAVWDNSASGDNNADSLASVTADFSQFGGGSAVAMANSGGVWTATYVVTAGGIDAANRNLSVTATDDAGNTATTADTSNATLDNQAPKVTDASISLSGASGTGGAYRIGDTVTAAWNDSLDGDNNTDVLSAVTVDFSQFGGGSAVAMANSGGVWTATYVVTADGIDATGRNVSVTVTDDAGNKTTTADTTNATLDNVAPTVTDASITVTGGTGGTYRIGDTVTVVWHSGNGGDANTDTLSAVTVDFSQFGGGAAVAMTNSGDFWTAKYVVTAGSIDAANRNVSVTATDNAGNTTTTADTTNATVDNQAPTVTDANITVTGGIDGIYRIGDTVTVTWNNSVDGDNNTDALSAVTVDFSQFGGGTAVAMTNSGGVWTATYTVTANATLGDNRTASVTATDDAGNSRTVADGASKTVANTAPLLDAGKSPVLVPELSTSTGAPSGAVGTLVSDLVGLGGLANVTDPDSGALTGIALTATDTSRGVWWYSTDGGATWTDVNGGGAVSDTNALLLKADAGTRLYLQLTDGSFAGTLPTAITFRAWDQTSGTAGTKVNTTVNGGISAFSAGTDTAGISITPGVPGGAPSLAAASDSGQSSSDRLTNATAITVTGSGVAANGTVRLYAGSTLVATTAANGAGAYQFTDADVSGLTGATSFTVRQVVDGTESGASAPLTVTFDRDRPTLTIATLSGDDRLSGTEAGSALVITGTSTAEVGQTVIVGLNGQTYTGTVAAGGGWTVTVDGAALGNLGNQPYTVTADVADAAGNTAIQATRTLTVDTNAPAVAVTSAALTNNATPVLAGTAEAGSTVTVTVGGATYATTADGNGGWAVDLATAMPSTGTLALDANGANAVSVTAQDVAGNVSAPATQTLVIDTTAPTATVRFEDDSIDAVEQIASAFVISDGEAGTAYSWTITSSGGGQLTGSGQLAAGTTRIGGLNLSGLGDGTLTVALSLTDTAGNRSQPLGASTQKLTATVDKPAPIPPPAQQIVDGVTVGGSVVVGADGSRNTTVRIEAPAADRQEDGSTPNSDMADVPVVQEQVVNAQTGAVSTVTTLTVSVQTGVAVTASGSAERQSAANSVAGLIAAIEERTDAGSSSRTGLTSGGAGFLSVLSEQAQLLVRSIDFTTPAGNGAGEEVRTRVTGGALGGNGRSSVTPTAVVLNTTGVNAPMTIQLDNVQFAAVIGNATLVGGDGEQVVYGDAGRQWLYLGDGDDELHGGAGDDTVASAGGNDTLFGDDGNDVVAGGDGDDWVLGGAGDDLIGGGTGNDRGFGGTGNDILFGEDGDDTLTGEEGNDTVVGGAGNDLLFGEDGADFLVGDAGNDTLNTGAGDDIALGGDGNDLIGLGEGNDLAGGDAGNDTLLGEAGNDTLLGGAGDDLLSGGAGDDQLFADGGADTLWGGDGRDLFAFGRPSGGTVVMDFQAGVDRLAFYDGSIDLTAVIRSARVEGGSTILDLGGGTRITILGQTGNVAGWFG